VNEAEVKEGRWSRMGSLLPREEGVGLAKKSVVVLLLDPSLVRLHVGKQKSSSRTPQLKTPRMEARVAEAGDGPTRRRVQQESLSLTLSLVGDGQVFVATGTDGGDGRSGTRDEVGEE
jgi:hypothetical protein